MHAAEHIPEHTAEPATGLAAEFLGVALLARAYNAIAGSLELAAQDEPAHPRLNEPAATFVTLRAAKALRGCIGTLQPRRSLDHDVRANAWAAAFRDPRFAPLQRHEFDRTTIEVSMLQPPQVLKVACEADAAAALRPYVDGLILVWRNHRATSLPQVWATVPHPLDFLRQLKRKAGLASEFWADDLQLQTYTVTRFADARAISR